MNEFLSEISPAEWALFLFFFIWGVIVGRRIWGARLVRQNTLTRDLATARTGIRDADASRAQLERDLAASRDQIRPLADEVERLRRDNARLQAATVAATPALAAASAAPAPLRSDVTDAARPGDVDDLRLLKGVGDKLLARLADLGIRDVRDMAALTPTEAARVDAALGPFEGRIARDQLIEQARLLADGRVAEFEARFGRLERP